MAEIVHHMQKRQYQRANDSYLRLSIGNAPWPIGVTMVGCVTCPMLFLSFSDQTDRIHERNPPEKKFQQTR
jgi:Prp18 domain